MPRFCENDLVFAALLYCLKSFSYCFALMLLQRQLQQVADRAGRLRVGQIPDTAVQVQPELLGQHFVGSSEAVRDAPFLEQCQVELVRLAAEDLPGHLDVAVGRDLDRGRRRRIVKRKAKCPPTEDVPVGDARFRLQAYQLILGLRRETRPPAL